MTHYSVERRNQQFVKNYRFLSFSESIRRNIGKNVSGNLCSKHSQTFLDHAKQSATDAFETASKEQFKK